MDIKTMRDLLELRLGVKTVECLIRHLVAVFDITQEEAIISTFNRMALVA